MATITLTVDSNWSTCSNGTNTGSAPGGTDTINLNGFNLNLDGTVGSTYTCTLIRARAANGTTPTAGQFIFTDTSPTISANITAGTGTTGATTVPIFLNNGEMITVNGTITGGTASTSAGALVIDGTITATAVVGGSGAGAHGAMTQTNGLAFITTATGGTISTSHGFQSAESNGSTVVTAVGGSVANAMGVNAITGGTIAVTHAKGGSVLGACGVTVATGGIIAVTGSTDLTGVGYPISVGSGKLLLSAGVKLPFHNASSVLTVYYDSTLLPSAGDVKQGVAYGGGDFTGSLVSGTSHGHIIGG